MTSRRQFLSASAAMTFTAGPSHAAKSKMVSGVYPFASRGADRQARLRDMTKDILPTRMLTFDPRHVQGQQQAHGVGRMSWSCHGKSRLAIRA